MALKKDYSCSLSSPDTPRVCLSSPCWTLGICLIEEPGAVQARAPLPKCLQKAPQPLAGHFVDEVSVLVEALVGVRDQHPGLGHNVGRAVQKDLPQDHLPKDRAGPARTRARDANRLVPEGRGAPEVSV